MDLRKDQIEWRTYKGEAGDLQSLLIGNLYGHEFSCLYNDYSPFQISFKRIKRKITGKFKILISEI